MLLGLASATSGRIRLLGQSMPARSSAVLPEVAALVEGPAFYPFLSGRANLLRLDSADPGGRADTRRARVSEALDRVGLGHAADKKAHAYSLGMKQRLGLAGALLTPRRLLILDEPSNGLDPQGTREVRSLITSLAHDGTTVFVSSHLLSEIEQMCTHAAVMSAGRMVASGRLDDLRGAAANRVVVTTPDTEVARGVLERLGVRTDGAGPASDRVTGELTAASAEPERIVAELVAADVRVRGFDVARTSLEERFVALTGEGFDVAR
jgi:ABC-2 type transport system ATP-binding protein